MQLGQSRQGSLNTTVVGDLGPGERDIEVAADDDALTPQVSEILNIYHVEALTRSGSRERCYASVAARV